MRSRTYSTQVLGRQMWTHTRTAAPDVFMLQISPRCAWTACWVNRNSHVSVEVNFQLRKWSRLTAAMHHGSCSTLPVERVWDWNTAAINHIPISYVSYFFWNNVPKMVTHFHYKNIKTQDPYSASMYKICTDTKRWKIKAQHMQHWWYLKETLQFIAKFLNLTPFSWRFWLPYKLLISDLCWNEIIEPPGRGIK